MEHECKIYNADELSPAQLEFAQKLKQTLPFANSVSKCKEKYRTNFRGTSRKCNHEECMLVQFRWGYIQAVDMKIVYPDWNDKYRYFVHKHGQCRATLNMSSIKECVKSYLEERVKKAKGRLQDYEQSLGNLIEVNYDD